MGLLLSSNAYAKTIVLDKNSHVIIYKIGKWSNAVSKRKHAKKYCSSLNKFVVQFWSTGSNHKLKPYFQRYYCVKSIKELFENIDMYDNLFAPKYKFYGSGFVKLEGPERHLKYDEIQYTNASSVPYEKYDQYLASLPKPEKKTEPKKQEPKEEKPKPSPDDNKVVAAASGSGFFVSNKGDIITNHHVIDQCKIVKVNFKGSDIEAKTLAIDRVNDIAILQANIKPEKVYSVSNEDVSLLEDVVVAGFPLGKKVSSSIKTHKGVVTSLAGAGDNFSNFQTDAAINQGNSGGPIINQKGNVVGIAVQTWVEEGVQGVHFGIKSSTLKTFASANGLKFLPPNNRDLSNKELGQLITRGTVYLECHMTIAKIKKMIAQENNRKAFFSEYQ